jgi:hypothetical protein
MLTDFKWEFNKSIGDTRINNLINSPTFEDIAQLINQRMNILCGHDQDCDEADGYLRYIYCIEIDKDIFDLFFNSRNGYRAWYFRSPYAGLAKNNYLINCLMPKLINSGKIKADPESIQQSFKSLSAKAWLAEKDRCLCDKCGEWTHSNDSEAELYNGVWDVANEPNSNFGKTAPYLSKIRIIGSFINARGEFVSNRKRDRYRQIHLIGWS